MIEDRIEFRHLVPANRILAHDQVVDALDRVSVRVPEDSETLGYVMARSPDPQLGEHADLIRFDQDCRSLVPGRRRPRRTHDSRRDPRSARDADPSCTITRIRCSPSASPAGRLAHGAHGVRHRVGSANLRHRRPVRGEGDAGTLDGAAYRSLDNYQGKRSLKCQH